MTIFLLFILALAIFVFPLLLELLDGGVYEGTEQGLRNLIENHEPVRPGDIAGMSKVWYSGYHSKGACIFRVTFIHTRVIAKYKFIQGPLIPNKFNHIIEAIGEEDK